MRYSARRAIASDSESRARADSLRSNEMAAAETTLPVTDRFSSAAASASLTSMTAD
jgi:hypothetical protein